MQHGRYPQIPPKRQNPGNPGWTLRNPVRFGPYPDRQSPARPGACDPRLRILKNSIGNTETPVYLYITPKTGTLRLPLATDQMVNLQIQETGMLEAFYDFCENLDEEMFYSFEEAEQIVEEEMKDGDWKTE